MTIRLAVILSICKWISVTNFSLVKVNIASFLAMSSSILICFVLSWYNQVHLVVVPRQTTPNLFWKPVFCCSEEVNSPSIILTLLVTVGLILFWFDKNLFLSLPEFVFVASTCPEFSVEVLHEHWTKVFLGVWLIP